MPTRRKAHVTERDGKLPPLPLDHETWLEIAEALSLSPQQTRIVELILRGKQDKEIADALGVSFHTVRTYLKRIFDRTEVADRIGLVLRVFALAQSPPAERCRYHE